MVATKKKADISPLEPEFVKPVENVESTPNYSFLQMYRYTTLKDKFILIFGLLAAVVTGSVQPCNAIIFGDLTNTIIDYAKSLYSNQTDRSRAEEELIDGVSHFALMNSLIGVVMLVCSYISTVAFNYAAQKQVVKIRSIYLSKILNQDVSWYDVRQTGDFASRMSDDLYKFEDGIGEKVPMFINFQVVFMVSLIIALTKGWELALICLTSLPASLIVLGLIGFLSTKLAKKELEAYGTAGAIAEEVLSSIRTVVAFGGLSKEATRYDSQLIFARKNNIRRSLFNAISLGFLWLLIFASYGLAFWYGVELILRDKLKDDKTYTVSNMVTVFFSVMSGSMSFGVSSPYIEAFGIARAAASKIFSVIDTIPIINLSKGKGDKIKDLKGKITLKNVQFHYPSRKDVPILQGLDLEIKEGDTIALVGSSGCGKSTVIQLIQRFYDTVSGEVLIDGQDVKSLDLSWFRSNIGTVSQEPVLFGTTILENIRYGNPNATKDDIIEAAKKANAHLFIKNLPNGYDTLVGERGAQLSGGQKQRVAIARALVRSPRILLLDEATSALDNTSEKKVQDALDSASKTCTTVIVAHRLSTIKDADKIVVLSQGKVVEQGTHDELMARGKEYYNLVMAQVKTSEAMEATKKDGRTLAITGDDEDEDTKILDIQSKLGQVDEIADDLPQIESSIFDILRLNQEEWKIIVIGCLASAVVGCAMPTFAVLFGSILSTLADPDDDYVRSESLKYAFFFVGAGVVVAISAFLQIFMFGIAGEKMTERVRSLMFRHMLRQEIGFFDRKDNGVGALCTKLSKDASSIQGATGQRVGTVLQSIATLLLGVGLSMYYEWRLGLLTVAVSPFIIVTVFIERRNTAGLNDVRDRSLQTATKLAVEGVSNIRTVASLGLEESIHDQYMEKLLPFYTNSGKSIQLRGIIFGLSRSLMFFAYSACMYYGGHLIKNGMAFEKLFKVSQALIFATTSIANSLAFTPNFAKGLEAARNIKRFLARKPRIQDNVNATNKDMVNGNIECSNIYFSYPTRPSVPILKGLDLSIFQGKTVALVGSSGCGKSTVIQLIERFYDPTSGDVMLDDENIKNIQLSTLRHHLGIVSQEPVLFSTTIGENIGYGDNSRNVGKDEIIQAAKNANIHNFIASLPMGYDTKLGEKGTQLSGGQKQRIAIARALVRNPKILLLDEATSALDTESEKVVQEALDKAKMGRTCITIAHRLTTIQDSDLICVVNEGVIAESGTHQELIDKNGLYYRLQTQNK